ncbi:MAG: PAAR-like domain-containing protein [Acidimicrobiia bacterium]
MPQPIAVADGICFAFPDILKTPSPSGSTPVPYPNIAQLADAKRKARNVNAGGKAVITQDSEIPKSSGGEAGTGGPGPNKECTFTTASKTVKANGKAVVRQFDSTSQNGGNAIGQVMSGVATVLVGG